MWEEHSQEDQNDGQTYQYNNNMALLVGVAEYPKIPEQELPYTLYDVRKLAPLLEKNFGFIIIGEEPLLNPSKDQILNYLSLIENNSTTDDSVLIYLSGHGQKQGKEGFFIPNDGLKDDSTTWLSATEIIETCFRCQALDILLVLDICFAGSFLKTYLPNEKKTQGRSIKILLAGTELQEVPELSLFARLFRDGLKGYAGDSKNGRISTSDLVYYIKEGIETHRNSQQNVVDDFLLRDIEKNRELVFEWVVPFIPGDILRNLTVKSKDQRISAIRALGNLRGDGFIDLAFETLTQRYRQESNDEVKTEIIRSLGCLRYPAALDFLLTIIEEELQEDDIEETTPPFVNWAAKEVEDYHEKRALPSLLKLFSKAVHRVDRVVIEITISSLMELVTDDEQEILECLDKLISENSSNEHIQFVALGWLDQIIGLNTDRIILRMVRSVQFVEDIRKSAIISLGCNGTKEIIPKVEEWLAVEQDAALSSFGKSALESMRKRYGYEHWDEDKLMYDMPYLIVVPDFPARYLENALNLDECERVVALVDIACNAQMPVGDRQISAISLKENESKYCDLNTLRSVIVKIEKVLSNDSKVLPVLTEPLMEVLSLFGEELASRGGDHK